MGPKKKTSVGLLVIVFNTLWLAAGMIKVPKREIFDRSDFPDFYTIKSLRVGDFGVKINKILKNI